MEKWVYFEQIPLRNPQGYIVAKCEDEFVEGENLRFREIGDKGIAVILDVYIAENVKGSYMLSLDEFNKHFVGIVDDFDEDKEFDNKMAFLTATLVNPIIMPIQYENLFE